MNIPVITQIEKKGGSNINSTDDLLEGTNNLYYTDARVDSRINLLRASTDDLPEGASNLYYTDARIDSKLSKPRFRQIGGWTESFENSLMATLVGSSITRETKFAAFYVFSNPGVGLSHIYENLPNAGVYGAANVLFAANTTSQGGISYQTIVNFAPNLYYNFYFRVRVRTISLATNGQLVIGLCTPTISIPPTIGAFFHFQKGVNSDRIRCICANGTSTIINLGVGYNIESTFYRTFEIHVSYTNVQFYIDEILVATITTNLFSSVAPFSVYMSKNNTSVSEPLFNFRCGLLSYYYEQV